MVNKMSELKGFIMSIIAAAAASALIEGFVPDGGMKKYVKYLISLFILLVLLSPLKSLLGMLPTLASGAGFTYESVEAFSRANSVVAMHIEAALCEKFSLDDENISVKYNGERISVEAKKRIGLIESDFKAYIANNFGVEAEVSFYE